MASAQEFIEKGDNFRKEKLYEEAVDAYKEALEIDPTNVDGYINLGLTYRYMEDYKEAIKMYETAIDIDSNSKLAWNNKGWALHLQGYDDKAIVAFEKSLEIDPAYELPLTNIVNIYKERDDNEKIIKIYEKAIEANPTDTDNLINYGLAFSRDQQYDKAIKQYKKAILIDDENKISFNNIGWAYYCMDKLVEAAQAYKNALKIDPKYGKPLANLDNIYDKVMDMHHPKHDDGSIWKILAKGYLEGKDFSRALDSCNHWISLESDNRNAAKLHKKIKSAKKEEEQRPVKWKKVEEAINTYAETSRSCDLNEVIEYIKYKNPDLTVKKLEVKFSIIDKIKDGKLNAEFDGDKLIFHHD